MLITPVVEATQSRSESIAHGNIIKSESVSKHILPANIIISEPAPPTLIPSNLPPIPVDKRKNRSMSTLERSRRHVEKHLSVSFRDSFCISGSDRKWARSDSAKVKGRRASVNAISDGCLMPLLSKTAKISSRKLLPNTRSRHHRQRFVLSCKADMERMMLRTRNTKGRRLRNCALGATEFDEIIVRLS